MTINLLDVSHWQGPVDWQKARAAGIQGAYIKASQGAAYRDPMAGDHYRGARAAGLLTGFYHFTTNDNSIAQYNNFKNAANAIGETQLPPAMDCEAFTSYQGEIYGLHEFETYAAPKLGLTARQVVDDLFIGPLGGAYMNDVLGLTYPSQDVIDAIGIRLLKHHPEAVAVYTNPASGNRIFTKQKIADRYELWVAHWGVSAPTLPARWKGRKYLCWQREVVEGAPYGVSGKVDFDEWGTARAWPGDPVEPPVAQKAIIRVEMDGKWRLFEEVIDG